MLGFSVPYNLTRLLAVQVIVNHETRYQVAGIQVWWDTEIPAVNNKTVKNGWNIQVPVDPRWTFDDDDGEYYLAAISSEDSVLVGIPAISYDHLYNMEKFPGVSECVSKEMDEHRNKHVPFIKKYKKAPMMWYNLKFPPRPGMTGVRLSVREIYQNENLTDDTSLDLVYFPCVSRHSTCGLYTTWWATWNVVCHDIGEKDGDRKRGAPDITPKKSKAAQQAELFAAMLYGTAGGGGATTDGNGTGEQTPDNPSSMDTF
jgi:hypothetical protein